MFQNINVLLRTVVLGGLVAIGGWWTLFLKDKLNDRDVELNRARQEVDALSIRVEDKEREIRGLGVKLEERDKEIVTLEEDIAVAEQEIEEKAGGDGTDGDTRDIDRNETPAKRSHELEHGGGIGRRAGE